MGLRRPDGRNQTAACPPVGVSAQGLQQNAAVSFGDRPRARDAVYWKAARNPYRPAWLASLAWRAGERLSLGLKQTVF